jgi:hypothetical protein
MNKEREKKNPTMNILANFFTDVFYNSIYLMSRKMKKSTDLGITDIYRGEVISYRNSIRASNDSYITLMETLCEFINKKAGHQLIRLPGLIKAIVTAFVPKEYISSMSGNDEDEMARSIITTIINEFTGEVLGPKFLKQIIDDHNNRSNTAEWHACLMNIQEECKVYIFKSFADLHSGGAGIIESNEIVSTYRKKLEIAKSKIKELLGTIAEYELVIDRLSEMVDVLSKDVQRYKSRSSSKPIDYDRSNSIRKDNKSIKRDDRDSAEIQPQQTTSKHDITPSVKPVAQMERRTDPFADDTDVESNGSNDDTDDTDDSKSNDESISSNDNDVDGLFGDDILKSIRRD